MVLGRKSRPRPGSIVASLLTSNNLDRNTLFSSQVNAGALCRFSRMSRILVRKHKLSAAQLSQKTS